MKRKSLLLLVSLLVLCVCFVSCKVTTDDTKTALSTPIVTLNENVVGWKAVENASGYVYVINGADEQTTVETSVALSDGDSFKVKAKGDGEKFTDSDWSIEIIYTASREPVKLSAPSVVLDGSNVNWNVVENAISYTICINNDEISGITATEYALTDSATVKVKAVGDGIRYTDSDWSDEVSYTAPIIATKLETPVVTLDGNVASWTEIANATEYSVMINGTPFTTSKTDYELTEDCVVTVQAKGDGVYYIDSDWSDEVRYTAPVIATKLATPVVTLDGNVVTWTNIDGAVSYTMSVNNVEMENITVCTWTSDEDFIFKVKAIGNGTTYSDSDWSNEVTYTAPVPQKLPAPTVTLVGNVASWQAIDGATSYTIEINGVLFENENVLEWSDDESYTLRVKANGNGALLLDSDWSETVTYTMPDPTVLPAPIVVLEKNVASWQAIEGAVSYTLEINGILFENENVLEWSDNDSYTLKVKAIGDGKHYSDSEWSNIVEFVKPTAIVLDTPVITLDGNVARWSVIANATTYEIVIDDVNMGYDDINDFTLDDGNRMKVRAIGDGLYYADSEWSNEVTYTAPIVSEQLSVPEIILVDNVVMWDSVENAVKYVLNINGEDKEIMPNGESTLDYTLTETSVVKVKAIGDGTYYTDSEWSETVSYTAPIIAEQLTAPVITLNDNVITWVAVDNAVSYTISVNGTETTGITATEYTLSETSAVKVKAIGDGTYYTDSEWSNEVTYTAPIISEQLSVPEIILVDNVVMWDSVENAVKYVLNINGEDKEIMSNGEITFEYTLTETSVVKVKAIGDGTYYTDSEWSETVTYTAPIIAEQLGVPEIILVDNVIMWDSVENAVKYVLNINGEDKEITPNGESTLDYTLTETSVVKVKAIGDGTYYTDSEWSETVSYTAPIIAEQLTAPVITLNDNVITWVAVDNAVSYTISVNGTETTGITATEYALSETSVVKVKAIGDGIYYTDSDWSVEVTYTAITFDHLGTAEDPYSMADLQKIFEKLSVNETYSVDGVYQKVYLKGYVTVAGTNKTSYQQNFYIADDVDATKAQSVLVYSATFANGVTEIGLKDCVVICGYLMNYNGTNEVSSAKVNGSTDYPTFISRQEAEKTDAEKISIALGKISAFPTKITENGELILPSSSVDGVVFVWSSDSEQLVIDADNSKATVTVTSTSVVVTLTVVATCGSETDNKSFEITLLAEQLTEHAGTSEDPFSTKDVSAIFNTLSEGGKYTVDGAIKKVYIKGYVTVAGSVSSNKKYQSKFYISDTKGASQSDSVYVYSASFTTAVSSVEVGDLIVVCGYIIDYSGTKQIGQNGTDYPDLIEKIVIKTDEDKLNEELNGVDFESKTISADCSLDLPTATVYPEIVFVWSSDSAQAVVNGAKLDITVPADKTTVTITLTAKLNDISKTKTFVLTLDSSSTGEVELPKTWQKLTDINDLVIGSQIIIVNSDCTYAMSVTQNSNNRSTVAISEGWEQSPADSIQKLQVVEGKVSGSFGLAVLDASGNITGYLYAASSSKNYLKTENTLSNNSSFVITVSDGVATIKAQGSYTRNLLKYNSSSNIFSCYASGQNDVSIYILKQNGSSSTEPTVLDTPVVTIDGNVAKWESVPNAVKYLVSINGVTTETTITQIELTEDCTVTVQAIGDGVNYKDSEISVAVKYTAPIIEGALDTPELTLNGNVVTWNEIANASSYVVSVDGVEQSVTENSFTLNKNCVVKVKAVPSDLTRYTESEWSQTISFVCSHVDVEDDGICDICSYDLYTYIDIYSVNDQHGVFLDDSQGNPGLDELTTYMKNLYADTSAYEILLSVGDMWQGTVESSLNKGALMTEWMNEIRFDAMTLGNHEFDWGSNYIVANSKLANFPILGINVTDNSADEQYAHPSVVIERGGIKIGVIGAIGNCLSSISGEFTQNNQLDFAVKDALTTLVKAESTRLRNEECCSFIVYMLHDGYSSSVETSMSGSEFNDGKGNVYYDTSLSNGYVDLVLEGHTHQNYVITDEYGVYHIQSGANNNNLGKIKLAFNSVTGTAKILGIEKISKYVYGDSSIADDPSVQEIYKKYFPDSDNDPYTTVLGTNASSRGKTEVLDLVAELYYRKGVETWGSEYNIVYGGGYMSARTSSIAAGDVTYAEIFKMLPFDNSLVLGKVTGSVLKSKFIGSTNNNYHGYWTIDESEIVDTQTYYIITDTYSAYYSSNQVTYVADLGKDIFARDLIKAYIEQGKWE